MTRTKWFVVPVVLLALLATSCSDQTPTDLMEPSMGKSGGTMAPSAQRISALIEALYPGPGLENAALDRWANIHRQMSRGRTSAARSQMYSLADQIMDFAADDRLEAPSDPLLPGTVDGAVVELVTRLFMFVGLEASEAQEEYPDALPDDFGFGEIDPATGGTVVTANRWAAMLAGPGTTDATVFVTIELQDEETCLISDPLAQAIGCWDFSAYPSGAIIGDLTLEICVTDDYSLTDDEWNLLLVHHEDEEGDVTPLPWANPTVVGDCDGFGQEEPIEMASRGPIESLLRSVGSQVASVLLPEPLAAAPFRAIRRPPRGLGGTSGSFSDVFGAVPDYSLAEVGTGSADTWTVTEPSEPVDLCNDLTVGTCPGSAPPSLDVEATATGPSGIFANPWAVVKFFYQVEGSSDPPTFIDEDKTPVVVDDTNVRSYTWAITLDGQGLPEGGIEVFAVGVEPDGDFFGTPVNDNITAVPPIEGGLPDLVVTAISWSTAVAELGDGVSFSYTIANIGAEAPEYPANSPAFNMATYLSSDDELDEGDVPLPFGWSNHVWPISEGWSFTDPDQGATIQWNPEWPGYVPPGNYYLIGLVNAKISLFDLVESDETNNWLASEGTLTILAPEPEPDT